MFKRARQLSQLVTYKEFRNGILGLGVVLGGLGLAFATLYAHLIGDSRLAGLAATASLGFVLLIVVFVIPPLARNASAEASQLNLPFEFTTGGAIFIGLIVIVAFAAWNTGNNLLFLVLSFVFAALIIGFLAGHFGLKKLDVKMRFPETVYVGEPTSIILSLHSRKRFFPTYSITAEVRGRRPNPGDLKLRLLEFLPEKWADRISKPPLIKHALDYFDYVPRSGEVQNQLEHIFEKRGRFEIKDFELSTKFPFALFRHRRRLPAQRAEIIVFPEPLEIEPSSLKVPIETGNTVSNKRGIGRDLIGMREYQPLDDLRHIDWKATARSNRMIVRDFAAEDELRVLIILDTRIRKSDGESKIALRKQIDNSQRGITNGVSFERVDRAVSKAAFILDHYEDKRAESGLITHDSLIELGFGKRHYFGCMRTIAATLPVFVDEYKADSFDERIGNSAEDFVNCHVFYICAKDSALKPPGFRDIRLIQF